METRYKVLRRERQRQRDREKRRRRRRRKRRRRELLKKERLYLGTQS